MLVTLTAWLLKDNEVGLKPIVNTLIPQLLQVKVCLVFLYAIYRLDLIKAFSGF